MPFSQSVWLADTTSRRHSGRPANGVITGCGGSLRSGLATCALGRRWDHRPVEARAGGGWRVVSRGWL